MKRRTFIASGMAAGFLPQRLAAEGASPVARVGLITAQREASIRPVVTGLRAGLAQHGHVEGRNLVMAFRYGEDAVDRIPALAAELAALPVDVVVAQGAAVYVLSKLGLRVPVVYIVSGDPVSGGLAD